MLHYQYGRRVTLIPRLHKRLQNACMDCLIPGGNRSGDDITDDIGRCSFAIVLCSRYHKAQTVREFHAQTDESSA